MGDKQLRVGGGGKDFFELQMGKYECRNLEENPPTGFESWKSPHEGALLHKHRNRREQSLEVPLLRFAPWSLRHARPVYPDVGPTKVFQLLLKEA